MSRRDNFGKVARQGPVRQIRPQLAHRGHDHHRRTAAHLSTAAYAFARLHFRGRDALFALVIVSLMIPIQVTIVPLFLVMADLDLTNTLWALILPPIFSAFGIFLLRQHFLALPDEIEEAAKHRRRRAPASLLPRHAAAVGARRSRRSASCASPTGGTTCCCRW